VKPLEAFFRKLGLQLFDVQRVPTKGGSLRCFVQLSEGPHAVSPSVGEFVSYESGLALDQLASFESLWFHLEGLKRRLLELLNRIKADGKVIAGYGAAVGITTMSYYFELNDLLSFCVDDDPAKQDLFTPGHHIPLLPSSSLYDRGPDYVLMLAWRYFGVVREKHEAFLENGGRFILPLPEIQEI
jgi:hypothetical protein